MSPLGTGFGFWGADGAAGVGLGDPERFRVSVITEDRPRFPSRQSQRNKSHGTRRKFGTGWVHALLFQTLCQILRQHFQNLGLDKVWSNDLRGFPKRGDFGIPFLRDHRRPC